MPRIFVAMGLAVLFIGCGTLTFAPEDDTGVGEEQPEAGPPPDLGMPDNGAVDMGLPNDCEYHDAPTFPAAFVGTPWPFLAGMQTKMITYQRLLWMDASGAMAGCTAANCHGYGTGDPLYPDSRDPLIPADETLLMTKLDVAVDHLWARIQTSNDADRTGKMYAHHEMNGTEMAKASQIWRDADLNVGLYKLKLVDRVVQDAKKCHIYGWYKTYESRLCGAGGLGDAANDAGMASDGAEAGAGDAGGSDCVCAQPFMDAIAPIDMAWALQNCVAPPP